VTVQAATARCMGRIYMRKPSLFTCSLRYTLLSFGLLVFTGALEFRAVDCVCIASVAVLVLPLELGRCRVCLREAVVPCGGGCGGGGGGLGRRAEPERRQEEVGVGVRGHLLGGMVQTQRS
jgi:hypothetical protein